MGVLYLLGLVLVSLGARAMRSTRFCMHGLLVYLLLLSLSLPSSPLFLFLPLSCAHLSLISLSLPSLSAPFILCSLYFFTVTCFAVVRGVFYHPVNSLVNKLVPSSASSSSSSPSAITNTAATTATQTPSTTDAPTSKASIQFFCKDFFNTNLSHAGMLCTALYVPIIIIKMLTCIYIYMCICVLCVWGCRCCDSLRSDTPAYYAITCKQIRHGTSTW